MSACDALRYGETYVRRVRDERDEARAEIARLYSLIADITEYGPPLNLWAAQDVAKRVNDALTERHRWTSGRGVS